ncbi:hypothetical protein GCM10007901_40240 [Dyella acidisoli]|uniref:Uncharacterized protein n=1 Tax=Dyella acidisoli TaxID=1867834 RepID=A0ABQ5XUA9_9GAMM|nr:hypothetical protein GCM10007901_40240 [Dyella acidisoli]
MIAHQHIGMHIALAAPAGMQQLREITTAIGRCAETFLAIMPALNDVLRHMGKIEPW